MKHVSGPIRAWSIAAAVILAQLGCTESTLIPRIPEAPALLVGGYGSEIGQFRQISAAALSNDRTLVVADNQLRRITWVKRVPGPRPVALSTLDYSAQSDRPALPVEISRVDALAASDDRLYVACSEGIWMIQGSSARLAAAASLPDRVYALALDAHRRLFALGDDQVVVLTEEGGAVADWKISGEGSPGARKMALGADGHLYIVSTRWNQILVFTPEGVEVRRIGRADGGTAGFAGSPRTIGVDPGGTLFAYDNKARAMTVIAASGTVEGTFALPGSGPAEALSPSESLVDRDGAVLALVDPPNYRIQFFDLLKPDSPSIDLVTHGSEHPATVIPDHLALNFGESPSTERVLTWRTSSAVRGSEVQLLEVPHGSDPRQVQWSLSSSRKFVGKSTLIQGNLGSYFAHEVTLDGLNSGRGYVYRAGDGGDNWTGEKYFEVPPDVDRRMRVVVLGDSRNRMNVWNDIINKSAGYLPAFIINTGDLVANGEDMNDWEQWFYEARDVLGRIPLMPCLGNHERNSPNYYAAFALPPNPNPNLVEQTYSFDYGPAHWAVLNSEYDLREQAEWLAADLARTDKPWVFVFYHRPAYAGHPTRGDGNPDIREAWEEIFLEYGIDAAWQGHDHYYFRSKPVRDGAVVPEGEGPIYITTGGSGAPLYPIQANQYMAVGESTDHYCVVDLTEQTCRVEVFRTDGSKLDDFTIVKRQKQRR